MKRDKDHTVREPEPQRGRSFYVRVGEKWFKISPKEGCLKKLDKPPNSTLENSGGKPFPQKQPDI